MKNAEKYARGYYMPPKKCMKWAEKDYIDHAPIWCSVDLRDGNQALIIPMSLEEKLEFFQKLVDIGFKEIEIGFPAASETEYEFCRTLIEKNLIPDDVTIQVLTQSREHIIKKTFEAIDGAKHAVVHLYNSTSVAQREQVFRKSKEEIIKIATTGAELCKEYKKKANGHITFEYSPESFTGTEPEFAAEICNAVIDIWEPDADNKVIINLPVTVEMSLPHVYAQQVEYMCETLHNRENVIISLHPHNDRGTGIADTELGLLAGGDRVEGTCFGNGERTGNVDVVTLALNMYTHGVEPNLDFTDLPSLIELYERVTRMKVYDRQPYSGALVYAAFSGSHQDAIAKGMKWRDEKHDQHWTCPYLPIDPHDVGREYEGDVIRINSQSGKGGIGFIMEQQYGYDMPKAMRENFGYKVKDISDKAHKELSRSEVHQIFKDTYLNITSPVDIVEAHYTQKADELIGAKVKAVINGKEVECSADGNGRLDAVANALTTEIGMEINVDTYTEHALERKTTSEACSYVGINVGGSIFWGVGRHSDIIVSSVKALVSAINNAMKK
ncbi:MULTISPECIES: 2-isopropylmalate synthase [Ruminococcus]|uniref:2-isopropylmalate synthase n=3 Tax=Ruminococcus TaxID=1263 RepID=E9S7H4_RUMAL|nr:MULTISPECIES: 2-isopropylmalate synthase [Ruminococcus]EGC04818.1 2-isopropylmalate synthase [Ruminococcus albus 8]MBR0530424.1 2-isopropylmalate synthase [Ruminococcus sp.]MCC3349451.1 2-isopropylmalate synthase [Ruminococcus albus 8]